jgi:hypothetical protein
MFKPWLVDFVPGFHFGLSDDVPGFRVDEHGSPERNPSAADPNILPARAPPTPCIGGWCTEGGEIAPRMEFFPTHCGLANISVPMVH